VVQVAKEPIGTKGARITSHVAIAGRHLVLTPSGSRVGVSRRIESDRERRRLREIVERLRPRDVGFIIRTAGEGAREADLEADVKYLASAWEDIQTRRSARAPMVLYAEPSLPLRVVRDVANTETKRIVVDSPQVFEEMMSFVSRFVADPQPKVELYRGTLPIFDEFGIGSRDRRQPRSQGVAQVGRLLDRRPERGAHRDRRGTPAATSASAISKRRC